MDESEEVLELAAGTVGFDAIVTLDLFVWFWFGLVLCREGERTGNQWKASGYDEEMSGNEWEMNGYEWGNERI